MSNSKIILILAIVIVASVSVSVVLFIAALNMPAHYLSFDEWFGSQEFGAFTDIASTDNLADFPTVYNANLDKTIEVGTTSVASITTLPGLTSAAALVTVGTITTGTWSADVIAVAKNGTGTTSPTSNQVILGNGSSGFKVVNGFGSSGQFLTSNGAAAAPTWQTSTVNQNDSYTWTALHIFQAGFISQASSTFTGNVTFATSTVITGIFPKATSTTFTSDGTWVKPNGVDRVKVRVVGGGGAGGGADNTANKEGSGGGAGAYCEAIVAVTGNVTVTVGAAGAGSSGAAGGNGGNSSFAGAVTVTANGGTGGLESGADASVAGSAGGSCTNANLVSMTGTSGHAAWGNANFRKSGRGADGPLGGGGTEAISDADGGAATGYGSGGGGAISNGGGTNRAGGAGAPGLVVVEWWQTTPY